MAAIARARRHLDSRGKSDVTLIGTGGLRTEADFAARACGHRHLREFNPGDLSSWKKEVAELVGIRFAGVGHP